MKCQQCGTIIQDGATFCTVCGTRVDAVPLQTPEDAASVAAAKNFGADKSKGRILLLIGGIIVTVFCLYQVFITISSTATFMSLTATGMVDASVYPWGEVILGFVMTLFLLVVGVLSIVFCKKTRMVKPLIVMGIIGGVIQIYRIIMGFMGLITYSSMGGIYGAPESFVFTSYGIPIIMNILLLGSFVLIIVGAYMNGKTGSPVSAQGSMPPESPITG